MEQYFVIFGGVIIVGTLATVMVRAQRRLDHSFSLHAAQRRDLYLLFAFGITTAMVVFALWFWRWLVPTYGLDWRLKTVFSSFLVLMIITAWIPYTSVLKKRFHDAAFYAAAGLLPVMALLSAYQQSLPEAARTASWIVLGIDLLLGLTFVFRNREVKQRYFVFQSIFVSVALLQLIAMTFLK